MMAMLCCPSHLSFVGRIYHRSKIAGPRIIPSVRESKILHTAWSKFARAPPGRNNGLGTNPVPAGVITVKTDGVGVERATAAAVGVGATPPVV
jgi:hypothetical protein